MFIASKSDSVSSSCVSGVVNKVSFSRKSAFPKAKVRQMHNWKMDLDVAVGEMGGERAERMYFMLEPVFRRAKSLSRWRSFERALVMYFCWRMP